MFKNLFKRANARPAEPETPEATEAKSPTPPVTTPKENTLDTFREKWDERWEDPASTPATEVIEGNGGNTDWGAWTDAVKVEENAFAPTVPMPLDTK